MAGWRVSAVIVGAAVALSLYLFQGDGFDPGEYYDTIILLIHRSEHVRI